MGFNFPNSPNAGDHFTPAVTGAPTYTWDGEKWTTIGGAIGTGGAPLDSPALIGNPTAPTPAPGDNDTSLATTAFVTSAINAAMATLPPAASVAEFRANSAPTKMLPAGVPWGAAGLVQLLDTGGVITPDLSQALDMYCSLTGSGRTIANPLNGKQGQKGLLWLVGGSYSAWGSAWRFPGGVKPVASGGWDVISFYVWDPNSYIMCTFALNVG